MASQETSAEAGQQMVILHDLLPRRVRDDWPEARQVERFYQGQKSTSQGETADPMNSPGNKAAFRSHTSRSPLEQLSH